MRLTRDSESILMVFWQSVVLAAGLVYLSGLLPQWGRWYSPNPHHRQQTDAFFKGQFKLSASPYDLTHDLAWSEDGVQQVWGLGVPAWRWPFDGVARIFGYSMFPDRVSFLIALAGVAACSMFLFNRIMRGSNQAEDTAFIFYRYAVALFVICFPPFVNNLRGRFDIYEETIAYGYLMAVLLALLLVKFIFDPVLSNWLLLNLASGLAPHVRPTLIFYGFAAVISGSLFIWRAPVKSSFSERREKLESNPPSSSLHLLLRETATFFRTRAAALWFVGFVAYSLSLATLFWSNAIRFGSAFEFGHRLNLQGPTLLSSMYATRIDYPFRDEPFLSSIKELVGATFLEREFNQDDYYENGLFPGQSPTIRWREFYMRTFDLSYASAFFVAVFGMWQFRKKSRLACVNDDATAKNMVLFCFLGLWVLLSTVFLSAFYLRTPAIASRYVLDFSAAFMVVTFVAICTLLLTRATRAGSSIVIGVSIIWVIAEISLGVSAYGGPSSQTQDQYLLTHPKGVPKSLSVTNEARLGSAGVLPFDRDGWDLNTGKVMPLVSLFLNDADYLELEIESESPFDSSIEVIQAKIADEFLNRRSVTKLHNGWRIRFDPPKRQGLRKGLQIAFLAFAPKARLADVTTPWKLQCVRWRDQDTSRVRP